MNHDKLQMFREKLGNISDYSGLKSPGLTCYLNSVLQVLFMTEGFREAVKRCCSQERSTMDSHLLRLFSELEKLAKNQPHTADITKHLGIVNVYEQRDAAEYFEKILCMTSPEASKIFRGQLSYTITCCACMTRSDSESFFWILPLSLEESSVTEGLRAFCKEEVVKEMHCDRCAMKGDATLRCTIKRNPQILTLLLKRFDFDVKRNCYVKLDCEVAVPQTLRMKDCTYDLYAFINHFGNLAGGHYNAQIKSYETGGWYLFNDTLVEKVQQPLFGAGEDNFRSQTAYLLMYRKVRGQQSQISSEDEWDAYTPEEAEGEHDHTTKEQNLIHQNKPKLDDLERELPRRTGEGISPYEETGLHVRVDKDLGRLKNLRPSQQHLLNGHSKQHVEAAVGQASVTWCTSGHRETHETKSGCAHVKVRQSSADNGVRHEVGRNAAPGTHSRNASRAGMSVKTEDRPPWR